MRGFAYGISVEKRLFPAQIPSVVEVRDEFGARRHMANARTPSRVLAESQSESLRRVVWEKLPLGNA
jgi:hypothetical protein